MQDQITEIQQQLRSCRYVAGKETAIALHLARSLAKPLLVEGPAGVGKTEIAKVMADLMGTELIRLQCHEGLDAAAALYDWNYPKQLLRIQMNAAADPGEIEHVIYSEPYLLRRPLLQAITAERAPVLLIDEIDRADEEFEAFLLEILSDFQVTVPELGTITARQRPLVLLTSNRVRELSDALRRRCLYLWIDYPDVATETEILRLKVPGAGAALTAQIARFLRAMRNLGLAKSPGVAEALDWAAALTALHRGALDEETVGETLGVIVKHHDDMKRLRGPELLRLLAEVAP